MKTHKEATVGHALIPIVTLIACLFVGIKILEVDPHMPLLTQLSHLGNSYAP